MALVGGICFSFIRKPKRLIGRQSNRKTKKKTQPPELMRLNMLGVSVEPHLAP
jgi:hypothetical protein